MTCDTWHVTCDTGCGVNILSNFQLSSSNGLGFMMLWTSGGKGSLTHWLTDSVNDEATLGLLNMFWNRQHGLLYSSDQMLTKISDFFWYNLVFLKTLVFRAISNIQEIISFLTMEYWLQTLQYFLGASGILHSTLPREYTD